MRMTKENENAEKLFRKRNLVYMTIIVLIILILIVAIFWQIYPNNTSKPKAAVIDQLGSSLLNEAVRYENQTFIQTAKQLLYEKFSIVDYYSNNATVDEYKNLASRGYKLIVWRAHSALDIDLKFIAISTSEKYNSKKYHTYLNNGQLTVCNISGYLYFGITPKFVEEIMNGKFEDTVIIFMSCNGLKPGYCQTAEAFRVKGVKVFLSWDGWIHPRDNDNSIELLLKYLIIENRTIGEAVNNIPISSSEFGLAKLSYYPTTSEAEGYIIPDYRETNLTGNTWFIVRVIDGENFKLANLSDALLVSRLS